MACDVFDKRACGVPYSSQDRGEDPHAWHERTSQAVPMHWLSSQNTAYLYVFRSVILADLLSTPKERFKDTNIFFRPIVSEVAQLRL